VPHGQIEGESVPLKRSIDRRSVAKVVYVLALWACIWPASADERYGAPPPELRLHLDRLVRSYPDWIAGADDQNVILKNGARLPISDHRTDKSFDDLIEHPDIDDMFYVPYPAGSVPQPPPKNADPGRVRYAPLFIAMYGDCRKNEVVPKLKTVEWLPAHNGGRVAITAMNGVDQALGAVSRALDQLPSEFMKFLVPTAGTYNCRSVAGSSARSMHAYGAAIDLNVTHADYWRWSKNASAPIWENRISIEIVRTFEQHGFIWGGYWYHFDGMHFEYRPELLPDESRP
jgi:D-alanyl-D-alanine carboxypeptidase-like protein